MRIYKCADYSAMSRQAAHIIAAQVLLKPDCVLGLAHRFYPHRRL